MRVLGFMHTLPVLAGSTPLLTGAALLALALALGACGAPQRVELTTTPITLPSAMQSMTAASSQRPSATRSASPVGSAPPPAAVTSPPRSVAPVNALPLVDASCGNQPSATAPKAILLACADGSLRLEDITYGSYGPASATGHAVMHANTCRPNCANGAFRDYPASLVLDEVAGGQFTRVTLHYAKPGPDGRTTASYPIQ